MKSNKRRENIMKTLQDIVDDLWKPEIGGGTIEQRYQVSKQMMQPFYGKDISEPLMKILNKVITQPDRFKYITPDILIDFECIKDIDTGFELYQYDASLFTKDESELIGEVIKEYRMWDSKRRMAQIRKTLAALYKDL